MNPTKSQKRRAHMKRNVALTTLVMVFVATLVLIVPATAADRDAACSLARAAGNYGTSDSGTVIGIGPRAAVALLNFDAEGNFKGKVTASLNGAVTNTTASGTYSVSSDCTGTVSFSEFDQSGNLVLAATAALVWDDNMREVRFLFTSAVLPDGTALGTVIVGDARKLVP
jgi:hypothetical protein